MRYVALFWAVATLIVILFSEAKGATVPTDLTAWPDVPISTTSAWSGAGPNACVEVCTEVWAISQLTDTQRAEFARVLVRHPIPEYLPIQHGDFMPLMAYQSKGVPRMDRGGTVAVLDAPSSAYGWQMDGWSFRRIDACGNWAVVMARAAPMLLAATEATPMANYILPQATPPLYTPVVGGGGGGGTPWIWIPGGPGTTPPDVVTPPVGPSPVPLPASLWMLLLAVAALRSFGKIRPRPMY